jgi:hypothetical protein
MSDHQMETDYARMFGEITEWVKQGAALSGDYRFERDGIQVDIMSQSPAGPFSCLHWKPLTNLPGIAAYLRPERHGASFMGFIDVRGGGKQNWSARESVDLIAALHSRISSVAADPALRPPLSLDRLRELLSYDKHSGEFVWRVMHSSRSAIGAQAGTSNGEWIRISIDGERYAAHDLAWLYVTGEWPSDKLQHIDGIKLHNGIDNLRLRIRAQERRNPRRPTETKGVWKRRYPKINHGMTDTPTHRVWLGMIARCRRPTCAEYHNYGGRGIQVCERWASDFMNFLEDVGERPSRVHSIDRYPNNDGNYEPGNCRWATAKEQANNRRCNVMITLCGERTPRRVACQRFGISEDAVYFARRHHKLTEIEAFLLVLERRPDAQGDAVHE